MGKLKNFILRIPLMPVMIIVMSIFIIAAVILSKTTTDYARNKVQTIQEKYMVYEYPTYVGGEFGDHNVLCVKILPFSEEDARAHKFYTIIYEYSSFFWCILSITIGAVVFYFSKLRKPIKLLLNASENVSRDNLDFIIEYDGKDELGQLCSSFEKMRQSVQDNNRTMWRMIEEKRRLNIAFSHELRTPLTVMRGNIELLQKYNTGSDVPENKKIDIMKTVLKNIDRIENYVYSMSAMSKVEDLPIHKKYIRMEELSVQLEKTLEILCKEKQLAFDFETETESENINVDVNIFMQVFENIVSNAVRYAVKGIGVSCRVSADKLFISVSDDGTGFSADELKTATAPYYSGSQKNSEPHFGLGLYLCKILCEKHKGELKLTNNFNTGACVIASFSCN